MIVGRGREAVKKDTVGSVCRGIVYHCKVQILTRLNIDRNNAHRQTVKDSSFRTVMRGDASPKQSSERRWLSQKGDIMKELIGAFIMFFIAFIGVYSLFSN